MSPSNVINRTSPLTLSQLCGYSTEDNTSGDASTIRSGSTSPPPLASGSASPMSCASGEDGWIKHGLYALLAAIDKLEATKVDNTTTANSSTKSNAGDTNRHLSVQMENTGTANVADALRALQYKQECAEEEEEDTWRNNKNK